MTDTQVFAPAPKGIEERKYIEPETMLLAPRGLFFDIYRKPTEIEKVDVINEADDVTGVVGYLAGSVIEYIIARFGFSTGYKETDEQSFEIYLDNVHKFFDEAYAEEKDPDKQDKYQNAMNQINDEVEDIEDNNVNIPKYIRTDLDDGNINSSVNFSVISYLDKRYATKNYVDEKYDYLLEKLDTNKKTAAMALSYGETNRDSIAKINKK